MMSIPSLTGTRSLSGGARGNLGTASHEFFHSWNTERLRAQGIEPFNFERANMSEGLWVGEGFTQYYGPLILKRAGFSDEISFVRGLAGTINAVVNSPARRYFSAVEMSMQAPFADGGTWSCGSCGPLAVTAAAPSARWPTSSPSSMSRPVSG